MKQHQYIIGMKEPSGKPKLELELPLRIKLQKHFSNPKNSGIWKKTFSYKQIDGLRK